MLGTFLATVATGIPGFVTWLKYRDAARDKKNKEVEAQKSAILIEEEKKKLKFVDQDVYLNGQRAFAAFETKNEAQHKELERTFQYQHDDLGRIVRASAIESSNASVTVQRVADEIRDDQLNHAEKIRETLEVFKIGVRTSLEQVHEKVNSANIEVAKLEGRVVAVENDRRTA